jgi:single-stranded-DNA-specific exonuclease
MNNQWQILPKIKPDRYFGPKILEKYPHLHPIAWQLLANRQIKAEEVGDFLYFSYDQKKYNPFNFSQMNQAVDLIIKHIKAQNKITIYGDYDADGVTASALLTQILSTLHARVDAYIPHRTEEGYGLNKAAIESIARQGTKLLITVDNGIRSFQEVKRAQELGLEVIITDHHAPPSEKKDWPPAIIINPAADDSYPEKYLAGVGVAFKLAQALLARAKLNEAVKKELEERLLDLVAIGTVADCVRLQGENRILVKKGLERLNKKLRPGLKELAQAAQLNFDYGLDTYNIGFQIAPRLNAAGRLGHAKTALELLLTSEQDQARLLAAELQAKNWQRQQLTEKIITYIEQNIIADLKTESIIIAANLDLDEGEWHEGVIGLVAGRLTEKYYLPSLVLTKTKNKLKGSGRSISELNIVKLMEEASEFLEKFGGHPAACGFSLSLDNFEKFSQKVKKIAKQELGEIDLSPKLIIDAELDLAQADEELAEVVSRFAPFGEGNPQPQFLVRQVQVREIRQMGKDNKHLKLRLSSTDTWRTAVGFYQADKWNDLKIGETIDIVFHLIVNEFNGRREPQLKIVDIKEAQK